MGIVLVQLKRKYISIVTGAVFFRSKSDYGKFACVGHIFKCAVVCRCKKNRIVFNVRCNRQIRNLCFRYACNGEQISIVVEFCLKIENTVIFVYIESDSHSVTLIYQKCG